MYVTLRHPGSGTVKMIEAGWSWSLFMGAGFLGLPLFFRGLAKWGVVMFAAWAARLLVPLATDSLPDIAQIEWVMSFLIGGLCLFLGLKGNDLTREHYLACGYELAEKRSMEERVAGQLWGQPQR